MGPALWIDIKNDFGPECMYIPVLESIAWTFFDLETSIDLKLIGWLRQGGAHRNKQVLCRGTSDIIAGRQRVLTAFSLTALLQKASFVKFSVHCPISAQESSYVLAVIRDNEDSQMSFLERKVQNSIAYLCSGHTISAISKMFSWFESIFVPKNGEAVEL